jgi:outer membrane protein TolC
MLRRAFAIAAVLVAALLLAAGCNLVGPNRNYDADLAHYKQVAQTVEHPELNTPPSENAFTPAPRTIDHDPAPRQPHEWWDLSVEEAIQLAVTRSSVLRDLGGTVVRTPEAIRTILNPAVVASDPRFGMEAALSEFDATLASSVVAEKNDRMINNFVASGGTRFFKQDLINFQSQISKVGAAGTQMTLRGISVYDFNNASFNRFPSVWDSLVEAEIRQPLWQGAGTRFNRLAGPNSVPGSYNGVLIARVNTDISVADFEIALRDLVSNVENAYWDLYFAYRDLDAKIQARNAALENWKRIKILLEQEQATGQLEREAQAREQYFRYEKDVQNSLAGTLEAATTNNNGSSCGSFRGLGRIAFEWQSASGDAVARRPELHRQRLAIKRREMEYVAARNFLLPRFDVVGRYRIRGLGKNLIGDVVIPPDPADPEGLFSRSSLDNLIGGDFQEWLLGGEVSLPIGFRRGYAAVRNAQLNLARDKAILEEQERQVIHDLSNAIGDMQRAYQIMETTYNRRLAAQQNVDILRTRLERGQPVSPEQLLEGERRLAEADIEYYRALVEHILAIKNVHFEKGTLLEYGHIQLADRLPAGSFPAPPAQQPAAAPTPVALPAPLPAQPERLPPVTEPVPAIPLTLPVISPAAASPGFGPSLPAAPPPTPAASPPPMAMPLYPAISTPLPQNLPPQIIATQSPPRDVAPLPPAQPPEAAPREAPIPVQIPPGHPSPAAWIPPAAPPAPAAMPFMRLPPPEAEPRSEHAPLRLPPLDG